MLIKGCHQDQQYLEEEMQKGNLDAAALGTPSLSDDLILFAIDSGILDCMVNAFPDKRAPNASKPLNGIIANTIAAKINNTPATSKIVTAITNPEVLTKLKYSIYDKYGKLKSKLTTESNLRFFFRNHSREELVQFCRDAASAIMVHRDIKPYIHIVDCTIVKTTPFKTYEEAKVLAIKKKGKKCKKCKTAAEDIDYFSGYKAGTIRSLVGDIGFPSDFCFGDITTSDIKLVEEMLRTTKALKPGDILICDRGFLSKRLINYLKKVRGVDVIMPLRSNMHAYKSAVAMAKCWKKWERYKARKYQKIALSKHLQSDWEDEKDLENDVDFNVAIAWNTKKDKYKGFLSTNLEATAKEILDTYALRWSIEVEYKQLKSFWELQSFKCRKLTMITFHIVFVMLGYLLYQLYKLTPEGEKYLTKSITTASDEYEPPSESQPCYIFYLGNKFAIFELNDYTTIHNLASPVAQKKLEAVMKNIYFQR